MVLGEQLQSRQLLLSQPQSQGLLLMLVGLGPALPLTLLLLLLRLLMVHLLVQQSMFHQRC